MAGELIALASAALYALSGVAIARGAAGDPERRGDNGAFLSILLTAGFSLALWLAWGGAGALPAMPGASIRAAIGLFVAAGVLSTVLGRLVMFRAIASVGAIRASMLRRLTPVFAALAALPLLAETPLPRDCLGMALVLAATAATGWSGRAGTGGQPGWAVWGIASAAFYGLAYVLRKMALLHLPAPAFGALIGNHEYMTIAGDLRYVSDGELAAFGDGPRLTPVGREPACSVAKYRAAFGPQSKYGRWILSHNAIVRVNDTLFMHGGLSPRYLHRKLNDLNRAVRTELQNPSPQSFGVGSDPEGPLWFRGLAESLQEQVQSAYLKELATAQGAGRIVMGHTIQDKGISLRADGKIALIDVGMSRWTIGGAPSCLVIERSGNTDRLSILR